MSTLLACIDLSSFAPIVIEHAAWAAGRMSASVRVLHVVEKSRGAGESAAGAISVSATSASVAANAAVVTEDVTLGGVFARAETELLNAGVTSSLIEEQTEDLLSAVTNARADASLVVIGKRGQHGAASRQEIGHNVQRLLMGSRPPMLVVARPFTRVRSVLFAFDARAAALRALRFMTESPLLKGAHFHLLGVGRKKAVLQRELDAARAQLQTAGHFAEAQWLPGEPERVIPTVLKYEDVDLLVMGSFGDPKVRRFIRGSTTAALLNAAEMPALVF